MATTSFKKVSVAERLKAKGKEANILEVKNLHVFFGRGMYTNHAVNDVSFNVQKGEVFGLVGESGSGKTTIGRAIAGLVNFASGTISVSGISIRPRRNRAGRAVRKKLVKNVQMIFQDPASSLNPYKPIRKIVGEGLDNIDVHKLFQFRFDNETISMLYKIIPAMKLPKTLKQHELSHFVNLASSNPMQLRQVVYKQVYAELKTNRYAQTYLGFRRDLREQLVTGGQTKRKIKAQLISEIIESVGISETMLNRYALEFSGGQQQRVGIARSVVMQPAIIVADEPISALDVSIQAQVVNIFNDLKEKLNLTFLFIAHDLRMVEYISDRIAVIHSGQILEIGDAHEVVNNPLHPYTRTLIGSIPTINLINESLRSIPYDPQMHRYSASNRPAWFQKTASAKEHYVFGTATEVQRWWKETQHAK